MVSYQNIFTPLFIIISLCIFIGGLVGIQVLDRLFAGSKNLNAIRMFGFTILINIVILLFLIMSFSKVKFNQGNQGPQGNKGYQGYQGTNGGLQVCGKKYQTVEEKKSFIKSINYLDMKSPLIVTD
jgi:hypothetical protein